MQLFTSVPQDPPLYAASSALEVLVLAASLTVIKNPLNTLAM